MKKIFTLILVILSIESFSQDTIYLQNIKQNAIPLTKSEIRLGFETKGVSNINVLDSEIMIVSYTKPKDGFYYSIYSINDHKKISDIITADEDDKGMISPCLTIMNNEIMISSTLSKKYTIIPIKSLHESNPEINIITGIITLPAILHNDSLIITDWYYFEDTASNISNKRNSRFLINAKDKSAINSTNFFSNFKYNTASLNGGDFASNSRTLIFGSSSYPKIEVLNNDLTTKKCIIIENIPLKHYIIPEWNIIATAPYSFSGCKSIVNTDTGFFILYHGIYIDSPNLEIKTSYIISLDKDANFIKSYSCQGEIISISPKMGDSIIYITERIDNEIKFYKLKFDE